MSSAQKKALAGPLEAQIAVISQKYEQLLASSADSKKQLEDEVEVDDDADASHSLVEMKKEVAAYEQGLVNSKSASLQIRAIQLNQRIGNVVTAESATVTVGMPQFVADKVREQVIGDVKTGRESKVEVGIFR